MHDICYCLTIVSDVSHTTFNWSSKSGSWSYQWYQILSNQISTAMPFWTITNQSQNICIYMSTWKKSATKNMHQIKSSSAPKEKRLRSAEFPTEAGAGLGLGRRLAGGHLAAPQALHGRLLGGGGLSGELHRSRELPHFGCCDFTILGYPWPHFWGKDRNIQKISLVKKK